jgi:hypothetical protein
MIKRLMSVGILLSLALFSAIVVVTGCSSNAPSSPMAYSTSELTKRLPENLDIVEVSKLVSPAVTDTIKIIKKISIDKFIVPAGALSTAKTISIKATKDKAISGADRLVFEFGPEGLVFNSAAHLNVDMAQLDSAATSASLYYFDPNVNSWVLQCTVAVDHGRVDFSVYHFSKYAIER